MICSLRVIGKQTILDNLIVRILSKLGIYKIYLILELFGAFEIKVEYVVFEQFSCLRILLVSPFFLQRLLSVWH